MKITIQLLIWRREQSNERFLENAKQTYILADASKIGHSSFAKVAPIKRAIVITSQGPMSTWKR